MVKRCIDITCVKIATSVGSTSEQYLVAPAPVPGGGCWAQVELGRLRAELGRAQGSAGPVSGWAQGLRGSASRIVLKSQLRL